MKLSRIFGSVITGVLFISIWTAPGCFMLQRKIDANPAPTSQSVGSGQATNTTKTSEDTSLVKTDKQITKNTSYGDGDPWSDRISAAINSIGVWVLGGSAILGVFWLFGKLGMKVITTRSAERCRSQKK